MTADDRRFVEEAKRKRPDKFALTQKRLTELLHYDPNTGVFTWVVRRQGIRLGQVAGCLSCEGYWQIKVCENLYFAHVLAWLYMTGKWPTNEIDHINGSSIDNHWNNLRNVTSSVNQQNMRKAKKNNKTGFLGVSARYGGFRAQIKINGKGYYLGSYGTPELAHEAYLNAKRKLHPGGTL